MSMTRPCSTACVRHEPGRTRPAALGRLALAGGAMVLAGLLVPAAALGPRYGRVRRAGLAASAGSRLLLRALGIRVVRRGVVRDGAALVVANHVSWVDILVIAATAPVVPVAKCEIAQWPVIGALARRVGAVFVPRRTGRDLPAAVGQVAGLLRRGHRVLIFPEATTTCGGPPAGFYRAGFQAAVDAAVPVVPVAIGYADGHGRPTTAAAFVGADDLLTSLWRVLLRGSGRRPVVATGRAGHPGRRSPGEPPGPRGDPRARAHQPTSAGRRGRRGPPRLTGVSRSCRTAPPAPRPARSTCWRPGRRRS